VVARGHGEDREKEIWRASLGTSFHFSMAEYQVPSTDEADTSLYLRPSPFIPLRETKKARSSFLRRKLGQAETRGKRVMWVPGTLLRLFKAAGFVPGAI